MHTMQVVADLEVHSKYARAVSPSMTLGNIAKWAAIKGINLVGTGDFTHPMWFREIRAKLMEAGEGVYKLKSNVRGPSFAEASKGKQISKVRFLLTSEVSCIYSDKGKGRRVHLLVYFPKLSDVERFNERLTSMGANLFSDGRPIIGLTLAQVAEAALKVNPKALVIPAHVWTPWFGCYGSKSGYDSLSEAFGGLEDKIPAIETGLSSDPAMNWRIAELTGKSIVSFGDAHSPQKLGREATVFEMDEVTYENVWSALHREKWDGRNGRLDSEQRSKKIHTKPQTKENPNSHLSPHISYTVEFYPEEGKYHYTGHRKCKVVYSPNDAKKKGMTCPVCGKILTTGVMSRVENLASVDIETDSQLDKNGVRWIEDKVSGNPPYVMLVPLMEIIAESLGVGVATKGVMEEYMRLIAEFGNEFDILLKTDLDKLEEKTKPNIIEAIEKVRAGDILIKPGYDGVFGTVKIWKEEEDPEKQTDIGQTSLF
jgi:PHP family Zn ribbon phosphoesterase